jgi:transposase
VISEEDYAEACRRYKDRRTKLPERQRYHALILATQGYSYREVGCMLLIDEETVSGWVSLYQSAGLEGLKHHPGWGGEHGQRFLTAAQLEELQLALRAEAMPGTKLGSGWTARAIRKLIRERYATSYSKSGVRKLLCEMGWSYQRGRKLYIRRSLEEQARFVLENEEMLARYAESGELVVPLAGDQSKVYLEATLARRWNPRGQQPLVADGARQKQAENIYGAIHPGTGEETSTFCIDLARLGRHHRVVEDDVGGASARADSAVDRWSLTSHERGSRRVVGRASAHPRHSVSGLHAGGESEGSDVEGDERRSRASSLVRHDGRVA